MTWKRGLVAVLAIVLLAIFGYACAIAGFVLFSPTLIVRNAQTDALITASVLIRVRDGRTDEAISMLETELESDLISHWAGFSSEDDLPEFWVFRKLNLGGLQFAARYLSEHPNADRDPLVDQIGECLLDPRLPDSRNEMTNFRAQIRACYDRLR